jgi:hypothetical protein
MVGTGGMELTGVGEGDGIGRELDGWVDDNWPPSDGALMGTEVLHFGHGTDLPIMDSFAVSRTAQFGQRTINGIAISNRFRAHQYPSALSAPNIGIDDVATLARAWLQSGQPHALASFATLTSTHDKAIIVRLTCWTKLHAVKRTTHLIEDCPPCGGPCKV